MTPKWILVIARNNHHKANSGKFWQEIHVVYYNVVFTLLNFSGHACSHWQNCAVNCFHCWGVSRVCLAHPVQAVWSLHPTNLLRFFIHHCWLYVLWPPQEEKRAPPLWFHASFNGRFFLHNYIGFPFAFLQNPLLPFQKVPPSKKSRMNTYLKTYQRYDWQSS
jgi:hypothetical protein